MRLDGRRESSNVEDRRGMSGGAKAGIGGIGAIVIAALSHSHCCIICMDEWR